MNLEQHLKRQMAFSKATFGPGERREGVIDHIKEEIEKELQETGDPKEWVDLVILSLDGLWRSLAYEGDEPFVFPDGSNVWDLIPTEICQMIERKQSINERRDWPDWRTADPKKAINHDRSKD